MPVGGGDHVDFGIDLGQGFSSTIMANTLVPADTLPVRGATALVAAMPVPASPRGEPGHAGLQARWGPAAGPPRSGGRRPLRRTAPGQNVPQLPGVAQGHQGVKGLHHGLVIVPVLLSMGNMPLASPTPSTFVR